MSEEINNLNCHVCEIPIKEKHFSHGFLFCSKTCVADFERLIN